MQKLDLLTLRHILNGFLRERSPLAALRVMFARVGNFFQIPLPGFNAHVVAGPQATRQVLVTDREKLRWRSPNDPVTALLRRGVLVVDGEEHDTARSAMEPALHPSNFSQYAPKILRHTDRVAATWADGQSVDMLVESRKIALLVIMDTLFSVDFWDDMARMWAPILKTIEFISPGVWVVVPKTPRLGYGKSIREVDDYLYGIIRTRQAGEPRGDLLDHLIATGMDEDRIRDHMLTMLIAGHDTSTALLAWTFALLGEHPDVYARLKTELDALSVEHPQLDSLGWKSPLLDAVIKESLRLYPPIHLGSRRVAEPVAFDGHTVPPGERLIYSIYLTHRDPAVWEDPDEFRPERFAPGRKHPPFAYVPFGGGPRACIGAAFGQMEVRLVLARLLQTHEFQLLERKIHAHMGATLEPRPGVFMRVQRRSA